MTLELPPRYRVSAKDRAPLIAFMLDALKAEGCRIIHVPDAHEAPFRITFETPTGERVGILAYAFLATETPTKKRPDDEHSFQIKYGKKDGKLHDVWQDPYGLYVTLFLGINPEQGFFVGADPMIHNPTKFSIRLEFKQAAVDAIMQSGWHAWERSRKRNPGAPVEVLVGGTKRSFLRYVRFEREAFAEDQGHRQLLAQSAASAGANWIIDPTAPASTPTAARLHSLAKEFELSETRILDLIGEARMMKMAVRGGVAEEHLVNQLAQTRGVTDCRKIDADAGGEGGGDVTLRFEGSRPLRIECKNALREVTAKKLVRVDLQRTRSSKSDPCSRYYSPKDFEIVAACVHAVTLRWEFRYAATAWLGGHKKCHGKLSNNVVLDERWDRPIDEVLREVVSA